jgi:hypothetical protein
MIQNIFIESSILDLRLRIRINIFDISRSTSALNEIRIRKPVRNRQGLSDARRENASKYIRKDGTIEVTGECILSNFDTIEVFHFFLLSDCYENCSEM